jgi:cytochrome c biogenesis protein CcdA/thiol-disulfide isomerase/thioredoxin
LSPLLPLIALGAGAITAISPCVLPVLPILFAGSAAGGTRRPYAIVAGLALSFFTFTLFAAWILDRLGLPKDLLRNIAIGMLFLVAATLIVPRLGLLLERPLARLSRRPAGELGGGFLLGASLGLVFVPCAGPVLGAITAAAATLDFGWRTLVIAACYSVGTAAVMLAFAVAGQRAVERTRAFRLHAAKVRAAFGVVIAAATLLIVLNIDREAQLALGSWWTEPLQKVVEENDTADRELTADGPSSRRSDLDDYGPAPDFHGIAHWLNTPGERALSLAKLRGKVVLVDFWTYSCINCIRTLPHVEAWHERYAGSGLVIVGVHSPEFAFEHELGNVRTQARKLGVTYPIALDNAFATWRAYGNRYWPAKYLIDSRGHVRYAHFGEGSYEETERAVRSLLTERTLDLPTPIDVPDPTPDGVLTPETYLGYERLDRYVGSPLRPREDAAYEPAEALDVSEFSLAGSWRIEAEHARASEGARLLLRFRARQVHLVLAGRGAVTVLVDGQRQSSVHVVEDRLYTLADLPEPGEHLLELRLTPGLEAYAFTFG